MVSLMTTEPDADRFALMIGLTVKCTSPSAGAQADRLIRRADRVCVLTAQCINLLETRYRLYARSAGAVSQLAYCVADIYGVDTVYVSPLDLIS
ncbi:hypothetical protein CIC12_11885 [Burkholderia sp. SG-MS1]|uniref:hypothetical protein n=1 Tax=Paraburkholderia sp. SG-MS1 TaxID=2023741 RepID=UPI0016939526|nr:hypothetical protein [Paraburkholderia sp. SG-MS1]NKJ47430.1 hypothetical protein [Paraburkholderia sp. SG-MS1]